MRGGGRGGRRRRLCAFAFLAVVFIGGRSDAAPLYSVAALSGSRQITTTKHRQHHPITNPSNNIQPIHPITSNTGIPLTKLVESEAGKLLALGDELHKRIIGQHEAVRARTAGLPDCWTAVCMEGREAVLRVPGGEECPSFAGGKHSTLKQTTHSQPAKRHHNKQQQNPNNKKTPNHKRSSPSPRRSSARAPA